MSTSINSPLVLHWFNFRSVSLPKQLILVLAGALWVALLAQIRIPLAFTPVPITLQTLGVLMVGVGLGGKLGTLSMLLYLALGAVGLPFYAGGDSGWIHLTGSTAGYLVGFVVAASLVGVCADRIKADRTVFRSLLLFMLGHAVIFALGVGWLALQVGAASALQLGFYPFIPGMLVKTLILSGLIPSLWKLSDWKKR